LRKLQEFKLELLSLSEYTNIANKVLSRYKRANINRPFKFNHDELLGEIINGLVMSDMTYDPNKGKTLRKYRIFVCIRRIQAYFVREMRFKNRTMFTNTISNISEGNSKLEKFYTHKDLRQRFKKPHETLDAKNAVEFLKNNAGLTETQMEHVNWFLQGKTDNQVAEMTGKTHQNVNLHLQKAIQKMQMLVQ